MSGRGWIAGTNPTDERLRQFGQLVFECCKLFADRGKQMTNADCRFCLDRSWEGSYREDEDAKQDRPEAK